MIALDTSSFIAYLSGGSGVDVDAVDEALAQGVAVLPPVVLTELTSDPKPAALLGPILRQLPLLEVEDGFWERAGKLRARVLTRGRRARLADALIAQSCLDHAVALVTRDADFRNFARWGGLKLVVRG